MSLDPNLTDLRYALNQLRYQVNGVNYVPPLPGLTDRVRRAVDALGRIEERLLVPDLQAAADVETWINQVLPPNGGFTNGAWPSSRDRSRAFLAALIRQAWQAALASRPAPPAPSPGPMESEEANADLGPDGFHYPEANNEPGFLDDNPDADPLPADHYDPGR